MQFCAGDYVAINIEIKQPAPMRPSGQGGVNILAIGSDGWSGDGTAYAMVWIEIRAVGATGGKTYRR